MLQMHSAGTAASDGSGGDRFDVNRAIIETALALLAIAGRVLFRLAPRCIAARARLRARLAEPTRRGDSVVSLGHETRAVMRLPFETFRPDLLDGDIVFVERRSWMQSIMNRTGDFWSHVAVVCSDSDGQFVVEMGPGGVGRRSLEVFLAAYRRVGVGRLELCPLCRRRLPVEAVRRLNDSSYTYSMEACTLLQRFNLARRIARADRKTDLEDRAIRGAIRMLERNPPHTLTCSGLVVDLVDTCCDSCRPAIGWPMRAHVGRGTWIPGPIEVFARPDASRVSDPNIVGLLSTPFDLWVALPFELRFHQSDQGSVVMFEAHDGFEHVELSGRRAS